MLRRIELSERSDVLGGRAFNSAGPYERLVGRAYFEADPLAAANKIITDIQLSPRNDAGRVEYSVDLYVLKPRDPARGNGAVLFDVVNRGLKLALWILNRAALSPDPRTEAQFGDAFLFEQGYTIAWLGWQWDAPKDTMRLYAPVATDGGRKIRGPVRSEFVPDAKTSDFSLGDLGCTPYPVSDPDKAQLTVRDRGDGKRHVIPRDRWRFVGRDAVHVDDGLEPGKIYEVVYIGEDPVLVGLGPAAIRDLVSFLKYGAPGDAVIPLGDQKRFIKRAICYGASQSGRFVREYIHRGFNQDEQRRRVFDGLWAHLAGPGLGSFDHRFAQPSRGADPQVNFFYPTFRPPFGDLGASASGAKVFYTDTSYEYWAYCASLLHASGDGRRDLPVSENVRLYTIAGSQHVPGPFPPRRVPVARYPMNPNDFHWMLRALLLGLDQWVKDSADPPASRYPRIADGSLVAHDAVRFPKIADVEFPRYVYQAHRLDFGPDFEAKGIVAVEPPSVGAAYTSLVPQVDEDGNEVAGVRMPWIAAPLGVYTGWNFREASIGAPETLADNLGSFFPFPKTKIAARYASRDAYMERVRAAAEQLVGSRFLRAEDIPKVIAHAGAMWDALA